LVPIYSNGLERDGLYGYTSAARVKKPSLTVSARGTIGKIFVRTQPFVPIIRLVVITPNPDKANLLYLSHALQGKFTAKTGSSIPQLPVPLAKTVKVIVPPLCAQKQFSDFSVQLDKSKSAIQKSLAETQLLFDSLMQTYFG
jgi:type I restriction enzyme S subunit